MKFSRGEVVGQVALSSVAKKGKESETQVSRKFDWVAATEEKPYDISKQLLLGISASSERQGELHSKRPYEKRGHVGNGAARRMQ